MRKYNNLQFFIWIVDYALIHIEIAENFNNKNQ